MSTYLVAFLVSNYSKLANKNATFPHRVFARPSMINSAHLALTFGEKALKTIGDYLQINYTFPKMDQATFQDFEYEGNRMIQFYYIFL